MSWKSEAGKELGGGTSRIQGESGGGRRKRSVNRSQPFSLLESVKGSNNQTSPREVLLEHQFNWAVNQTGEGITIGQLGGVDEHLGEMWELEGGNLKHMMGARRQKRVKRSPRGPPYWLNPANNLVVDDPPPPEVSLLQHYNM